MLGTDPRLTPGAYVTGDSLLYEVMRVDSSSDEVVLEDCRTFARRRVPVTTICRLGFAGSPPRWKLVRAALRPAL